MIFALIHKFHDFLTGFVDERTQHRLDALEASIQRGYVSIEYKNEILEYENEETELKQIAIDRLRETIKLKDAELEKIASRRTSQEDEMKRLKDHHSEVSNSISKSDRKRSKLIEEISSKEAEIKELEMASSKDENDAFSFHFYTEAIDKVNQVGDVNLVISTHIFTCFSLEELWIRCHLKALSLFPH